MYYNEAPPTRGASIFWPQHLALKPAKGRPLAGNTLNFPKSTRFPMQDILAALQAPDCRCDIHGLQGAAAALLLARTSARLGRSICCIVADDSQLDPLSRDIGLFSGIEVLLYPSFEIPPYAPLAPDPATVATRLATLFRLQHERTPCILLCSAEALLRRILPVSLLEQRSELIMAGEDTDRDALIRNLTQNGYQQCALVQQEGDLAVRGSIIDIYCPPSGKTVSGPLRLDFFGDTVESIRVFDPVTQRSLTDLEEAILLPATDILFAEKTKEVEWLSFFRQQADLFQWPAESLTLLQEKLYERIRFSGVEFYLPLLLPPPLRPQTLFDYLQPGTLLIQLDPPALQNRVTLVRQSIEANYAEARNQGQAVVPPDQLFLNREQCHGYLDGIPSARFCTLPDPDSDRPVHALRSGSHTLLRQEIDIQRKKSSLLAPLIERLKQWQHQGERILLACRSPRQVSHFQEIFRNYQLATKLVTTPLLAELDAPESAIRLVNHPLTNGVDLIDEKLHLLSSGELFGDKRLATRSTRKESAPLGESIRIDELHRGDVVVHRDHGLGVFLGLFNMEVGGIFGDFMQIEYRGGDKLYVPVDKLHRVSRYQGLSDQLPRLDQLGSSSWQTAKKKVSEAVWKVAQELLTIYARRAIRQGHAFSPVGEFYQSMEETFPYEETEGQQKAINEVLADMMESRPMDRLICGDVGYGKTEVAMRAVFKSIEDGFQVAVLVPTTVLAEQHAATFRDRFATFPVRTACLNRFRSPGRQKEIVAELAAGQIDVIVGTHRLLSKDIVFKKLGLLIVDEEHRFGVSHKEQIKKLRAEVDILTLTATPIPRTLQMSLLGIRDLSVISTPPRQRRSIKTFLARFDDLVIREGVSREMQRGGQVFFVHNRVQSIHAIAEKIQNLVPGARVAVAHGQMPGPQLETIMVSFINHELDVLVCTTIIESGLDISNANTIIINRAEHLGLADIYQLRGRVGRADRQAYAYLLVPSLEKLTEDARERLRALMDASELGSGFQLAMNDLQIRGGGNLLGVSQSGHIAAVGYDLYLELLQATVAELKDENGPGAGQPPLDPEIKLKLPAFLPEHYIEDISQRYHLYRRISAASTGTPEDLEQLAAETRDRYGRLPVEAENLFDLMRRKFQLRELGIAKLEQGPDALIYSFTDQSQVNPQVILSLIQRKLKKGEKPLRLTPDNRFIVPLAPETPLFQAIDLLLASLA